MAALRFVEFLADTTLLREARELADRLLEEDPELTGAHAALRQLIQEGAGAPADF